MIVSAFYFELSTYHWAIIPTISSTKRKRKDYHINGHHYISKTLFESNNFVFGHFDFYQFTDQNQ